jgi:hypothetical protein
VATSAGSGRRLTAITIDQGVSSLSNVLVVILAARVLGADTFGLFGVISLVYLTTQGFARALVGEPLLVRPQESQERPGEAIGSAALLGVALGLLVVGAGLALSLASADLGRGLVAFGAFLPLMMLQDLGRYLAVATHQPGRALVLDLLWLGLELVAVAAIVVADAETLTWFVLAWAGSGAAASGLLLWQHRGHRVQLGLVWLRETWPLSWRYATAFAARQGAALAGVSFVGGALGARAMGAVTGALLVFGPQVQLQAAAMAAGVSEVAHLPPGGSEVGRQVRITTVLCSGVAALNLVALLLLPDRLGRLVLGDVWEGTQALLWPVGVQMLAIGLMSGVRSGLVGMKALSPTLRMDILQTTVAVVSASIAVQVLDTRGTYWVMAVGQIVVTLLWWTVYGRQMRRLVA